MRTPTRVLVLPTFGSPNSPLGQDAGRWTDGIPPLVFGATTIHLDYESLLFFDRIEMDSTAAERIYSAGVPAFERVAREIRFLEQEGIIHLSSHQQHLQGRWEAVVSATKDELAHPLQWLPHIQQAVSGWDDCQDNLQKLFTDDYCPSIRVPYGIAYSLELRGEPVDNSAEESRVRNEVRSMRKGRNEEELDLLRDVAHPYLLHANAALAVARELDGTVLDWGNVAQFYATKALRAMDSEQSDLRRAIEAARSTVLSVPAMRIDDIEQLVRVLRDRRISDFRMAMEDSVASGEPVDTEALNGMLIGALQSQGVRIRRRKWIGRLGALASLIPGASVLPAIGEAVAERGADATQRAKDMLWVYLFLDAKG